MTPCLFRSSKKIACLHALFKEVSAVIGQVTSKYVVKWSVLECARGWSPGAVEALSHLREGAPPEAEARFVGRTMKG